MSTEGSKSMKVRSFMMDDNTTRVANDLIAALSIVLPIIVAILVVPSLIWGNARQHRTEQHLEEMQRFESCYQEWEFNEAHQMRWLRIDYCGTPQGEEEAQ